MDIAIVKGEYWCGFYINGELAEEGHSFDLDWLEYLKNSKVGSIERINAYIYLEEKERLPKYLFEILDYYEEE